MGQRPEMMERRGKGFPGVVLVLATEMDPFFGKLRHFPNLESHWILISCNDSVPGLRHLRTNFHSEIRILNAEIIFLNISEAPQIVPP